MSRHYRKRKTKVNVNLRPLQRASAHGGQFGISGIADAFGLWDRVKKLDQLDPRKHKGKGYDPCVYVASLLFSFTSGGDSLMDAYRLDEDIALKKVLGIEKFPDDTTIGEWLRAIGHFGFNALRSLNRELVQWALNRAEDDRLLHCGELDNFFDDTQFEVNGKCFEGAAINYNGDLALSWQTLWTGPFIADAIMGTPAENKFALASNQSGKDVSAWLPDMLKQNQHLWSGYTSHLYADSASSAGKYLESIEDSFSHFSVSYNKWTGPLEKAADKLPEDSWSESRMIKWRDGKEHQAQYNWLIYRPSGCQHNKSFAVLRHRKGDGELFWQYAFVVGNSSSDHAQMLFERHNLKGEYERLFGEILMDMGLHHPPCQKLNANNAYYCLAVISFNFLQALKLIYLPAQHQPKRIRTLIHQLLLVPVQVSTHSRQLQATLHVPQHWFAWWEHFIRDLPCCRRLSTA